MTKLPQDLEDKLATVPEDFHAPLRSWVMGAYLAGLRDGSRQQASEPAERTERETIIASLTFIQRKVLHHLESLTAGGTVPTTQSHLARACGYPSAPYIRSPLVRLHALGLVLDMAPPGSGRPDLRPVLGAPVAPPPPVRKPAPAALAAPLAASGPALVPEPAREARRPLPARPAAPGPAQNVTAALLGADGNGGRSRASGFRLISSGGASAARRHGAVGWSTASSWTNMTCSISSTRSAKAPGSSRRRSANWSDHAQPGRRRAQHGGLCQGR